MTNQPRRIRPVQAAAQTSMSVSEAAQLINELSQPIEIDDQDVDLQLLDQVIGQPGEVGKSAISNARDDDLWDVLFGVHASITEPELKHLAAWELWNRFVRQAGTDSWLTEELTKLHTDNGYGFCEGCGQNENDIYLVHLDECPTLALIAAGGNE